jgi:hypothetical protein
MIAQATPQSSYMKWTPDCEREVLIGHRDELVTLVKGHRTELQASLERWRDQRRGSVKAMWRMIAAIGQGKSQIAVIDLQLESIAA